METRNYPGIEVNMQKLIEQLRQVFDNRSYKVRHRYESSGFVLEADKSSKIRDWIALSHALTIKVTPEHQGTRVWVGKQKWFEKLFVLAVGIFFYTFNIFRNCVPSYLVYKKPQWEQYINILGIILIALTALGMYFQYTITQDAWNTIEDHIALESGGSTPPKSTV
jgi:hypothetical protein